MCIRDSSYTPDTYGNDEEWEYSDYLDDTTSNSGTDDHPNQNDSVGDPDVGTTTIDNEFDINRTYKNPVREILIEGWHDFDYDDIPTDNQLFHTFDGGQSTHEDGVAAASVSGWGHPGGAYTVTRHTPFALRVLIQLNNDRQEQQRGEDGETPGPGEPYEETNSIGERDVEVNISFQPVGETNEVAFKHEAPSGTTDE